MIIFVTINTIYMETLQKAILLTGGSAGIERQGRPMVSRTLDHYGFIVDSVELGVFQGPWRDPAGPAVPSW